MISAAIKLNILPAHSLYGFLTRRISGGTIRVPDRLNQGTLSVICLAKVIRFMANESTHITVPVSSRGRTNVTCVRKPRKRD